MVAEEYNLSDEITRKAGDAYSWLDNEYKRGQISDEAFYKALVALDIALLGLIPDEYSKWAVERRTSLKNLNQCDRSAFVSDTRLVVLTLDRAWSAVNMTAVTRTAGGGVSVKCLNNETATDPAQWAQQRYSELCQELINKGFKEIK